MESSDRWISGTVAVLPLWLPLALGYSAFRAGLALVALAGLTLVALAAGSFAASGAGFSMAATVSPAQVRISLVLEAAASVRLGGETQDAARDALARLGDLLGWSREDRFSGKRFEAAPGVNLSSVVFRSSGRDLTAASTCIGMASRVIEPVLLGLTGVAVRDRVKR